MVNAIKFMSVCLSRLVQSCRPILCQNCSTIFITQARMPGARLKAEIFLPLDQQSGMEFTVR